MGREPVASRKIRERRRQSARAWRSGMDARRAVTDFLEGRVFSSAIGRTFPSRPVQTAAVCLAGIGRLYQGQVAQGSSSADAEATCRSRFIGSGNSLRWAGEAPDRADRPGEDCANRSATFRPQRKPQEGGRDRTGAPTAGEIPEAAIRKDQTRRRRPEASGAARRSLRPAPIPHTIPRPEPIVQVREVPSRSGLPLRLRLPRTRPAAGPGLVRRDPAAPPGC